MAHRRKSPSPGTEGVYSRKPLHDEKSSLLGIPNPFSNRNTPILKQWTELGEFCRNKQHHFLHPPPTKLRRENIFEKGAQADVVASVLRRLDRDMATVSVTSVFSLQILLRGWLSMKSQRGFRKFSLAIRHCNVFMYIIHVVCSVCNVSCTFSMPSKDLACAGYITCAVASYTNSSKDSTLFSLVG